MGRTRALKEAQRRYRTRNLELHRKYSRESAKRRYDREHLADSTLISIRKLFVKSNLNARLLD